MVEGVLELVEQEITCIRDAGLNKENLDMLFKLVDIHKDIIKEKMMEKEEENMYNYGRGEYGRRRRDSRGRYMEGEYGRRGNFRDKSEEMFERMQEGYNEYNEAMGEYNRGNYNAKDEGIESLEYMLESFVQFFEYIQKNAENEEEVELIKKYAKKIKEM